MKLAIFLTIIITLSLVPVSFAESGIYSLDVDAKSFDIPYDVNGHIIAMKIDTESKSLLVGLEQVKESIFTISPPTELISAANDNFIVLVDGYDTDFVLSNNENNADINYAKLTSRFPKAKRINGVNGIYEAHASAAKLANTPFFWVVDADAIISPEIGRAHV